MIQNEILKKLTEISQQPFLRFFHRIGEKTDNTVKTLILLTQEEQVTAGRISEYLDIKPSSVTQIIKKLESMSAVEKVKSSEDARVVFVEITPQGKQFLEDNSLNSATVTEGLFTGFSESELLQLNDYLAKIEENVKSESFRQKLNATFADDKKWKKFEGMSARFEKAREQMIDDERFAGRHGHRQHRHFHHEHVRDFDRYSPFQGRDPKHKKYNREDKDSPIKRNDDE